MCSSPHKTILVASHGAVRSMNGEIRPRSPKQGVFRFLGANKGLLAYLHYIVIPMHFPTNYIKTPANANWIE